MFSATVRFAHSESSWNTQRTPGIAGGVSIVVGHGATIHFDAALRGRIDASEHGHQRGFARAVVPRDAYAFALHEGEADIFQRAHAPESLADAFEADQRVAGFLRSSTCLHA